MIKNLELTVVYDNNPMLGGLEQDWGFSCYIDTGLNKILFDTGDNGNILLSNMNKLGIDPISIDTLFLSHFHHDHTGGLKNFLDHNSRVNVFYPESFPEELTELIRKSGAGLKPVSVITEVFPDFYTLGEIIGPISEQAIAIRSTSGIVVITGCAHPGILNILQVVRNYFPDEAIYLVLGGFHLFRLNEDEITDVVGKLFEMDILTVAPTHCTGDKARGIFQDVFGSDLVKAGTGKKFIID
ncbi:MAG TPA: MBL fold metallo-hydrolase [Melioribacteraceae bacterium]|nr:MBL fold metallo-hydrolase [Melioribacteraceae bacterium]